MRTVGSRQTAETAEDVENWVRGLDGCPPVTRTAVAVCSHPSHGEDPANWFYVEADATAGVARLRCLSGGHVNDLLNSAEHWTYPGVWSCRACNHSIAEVIYGIHDKDGVARWMLIAVRCVECGDFAGVTDIVTGDIPIEDLLARL